MSRAQLQEQARAHVQEMMQQRKKQQLEELLQLQQEQHRPVTDRLTPTILSDESTHASARAPTHWSTERLTNSQH